MKMFFAGLIFHRIGVKLQILNTYNNHLMIPVPNSNDGNLFMANTRGILRRFGVGVVFFSLFSSSLLAFEGPPPPLPQIAF
jgi:hypothetical protein